MTTLTYTRPTLDYGYLFMVVNLRLFVNDHYGVKYLFTVDTELSDIHPILKL